MTSWWLSDYRFINVTSHTQGLSRATWARLLSLTCSDLGLDCTVFCITWKHLRGGWNCCVEQQMILFFPHDALMGSYCCLRAFEDPNTETSAHGQAMQTKPIKMPWWSSFIVPIQLSISPVSEFLTISLFFFLFPLWLITFCIFQK